MRPQTIVFALCGALWLGCGAAAQQTPPARRLLGRPAPGVKELECLSSYQNDPCKGQSLAACEQLCRGGDMQSCLRLSERYQRGTRSRDDLLDQNAEAFDPNPAKALELLRLACKNGFLEGCFVLAERHPKEAVALEALPPLQSACAKDTACGCALFAVAYSYIHPKIADETILHLLDRACEQGALLACDELLLTIELCRADMRTRPACATLKAQNRIPLPEPVWEKNELTAPWTGCFEVTRSAARENTPNECTNSLDWGWGSEWKTPAKPPEPCPPVPGTKPGTIYCFGADRVFIQSGVENEPKAWDQERGMWQRLGNLAEYRFLFEGASEHAGMHLKSGGGSQQSILMYIGNHTLELEALRGPAAQRAQSEIQALPRVEDVCARSRRCEMAIIDLLAPPAGPDSAEISYPEPGHSLSSCINAQREAIKRLRQEKGASASIPEDCKAPSSK